MSRNINQTHLIEKIIKFIELHNNPLSAAEKAEYRVGLCHGFSISYSYMVAVDAEDWWNNALDQLSRWDEQALPDGNPLKQLFERVCYYVIFNQRSGISSNNVRTQQNHFFIPNGLFFSERGPITSSAAAAGNFSKKILDELLDKTIFSGESIFLIKTHNHACAFHYKNLAWHYYDPNKEAGKIIFFSKDEFIFYLLGENTPKNLTIFAATWNPKLKSKINALNDRFLTICEKESSQLFAGSGDAYIHEISKTLPKKTLTTLASINLKFGICTLPFFDYQSPTEMITLITAINDSNTLISDDKKTLLSLIKNNIAKDNRQLSPEMILVHIKVRMLFEIENYLSSRRIETPDLPRLQTNLIRNGIFRVFPNRDQKRTEAKIADAENLKRELLLCTEKEMLSDCIQHSMATNRALEGNAYFMTGAYGDCLDHCMEIINCTRTSLLPRTTYHYSIPTPLMTH